MGRDLMLMLYQRMYRIRSVEERIKHEYQHRNIRMAVHLSIGQEAVAVGVLAPTRAADCCLSTHRCHAHYLGKQGDLQRMIDELYSLDTGCSHGNGGSMHLFDRQVGMWGSGAIVGGSVPMAVGMGLALKQARTDNVCVSFVGDGGVDEGVFFESLNLAALFNVPVLFVVENNGYSTITSQESRQAAIDVAAKARSFGVDSVSVDGNNVLEVYETCQQVLESIRRDQRPRLIEAVTFRLCAHVGPGTDFGSGRRPEEELERWAPRDPLRLLEQQIEREVRDGVQRLAEIQEQVLAEINGVFETAQRHFNEVNEREKLEAPRPPDPSRV
jgi:TPP-dependent pyruvate/acetoin dehydrogenase alpha subunit